MATVSKTHEQIKELQILYNKYKDFYILFGRTKSKPALLCLNTAAVAYLKRLEETKQEVNLRKK